MSGVASTSKTYSSQFWLLCLSSLLFFASFNMIIPELPAYLTSLGGAEFKGLIIGLFTLSAMISRPFSGKLADKVGRVPVIVIGTLVCFVCGFLYPLLSSVAGFLTLRLVHGFSTGFSPTGTTAILSDVVPPHKRGEAMGLIGTAGSVGMAAGPTLGGVLANQYSLDLMFYCSSLLAVFSLLIIYNIKETLPDKSRFTVSMLRITRHEIFERRVWIPCLIMLLSIYSYGAVFTVIPDFGDYVGIRNKGLLFAFLTVASLTVRLIAGRASDVYGRKAVLRVATALITIAMVFIGLADSRYDLMIGMTIYGLAQGMTSPTLLAWAADLSDERNRGKGIASLYIFLELAIFCGSIGSGFFYANRTENFSITFFVSAALSAIAFVLLFVLKARDNRHMA